MQGVHNNKEEVDIFIEKHTDYGGRCYTWTGRCSKSGYGIMHIGGAVFSVRRVVWWLQHDYLPRGDRMGDTCGNKLCHNLNHLTDRTPQEDRRANLFREGKSFNAPRISREKAAEIWEHLILGDTTVKEAARKCGTSTTNLRKHIRRYEETLKSGL